MYVTMATGLICGRHWAAFAICQLTSIVVEDLTGRWIVVAAQKPHSGVENRGCMLPNKDTLLSRFGGVDEKWFAHRQGGGGQVIIFGLGTPTLLYSERRSALGGAAGLGCCSNGRHGSHDNWRRPNFYLFLKLLRHRGWWGHDKDVQVFTCHLQVKKKKTLPAALNKRFSWRAFLKKRMLP